jgi:hypothetical protein
VGFLKAVQTDSNVRQTNIFEFFSHGGGDERPVCRENGSPPLLRRISDQVKNVRTNQGLPAREQNDRRSKPREVVNQALTLIKREFSAVAAVFRLGVAMNASKVATAGYVPNYDGLLVSRKLQQV